MSMRNVLECIFKCVLAAISPTIGIFAFLKRRENRKSDDFEIIQKLEQTFDEKVACVMEPYFNGLGDFQVHGNLITPRDAENAVEGVLRWFSSLGIMLTNGIVSPDTIERYKCTFHKVAALRKVKIYLRELVNFQDGCRARPYCGFIQLALVWEAVENAEFYQELFNILKKESKSES